MNKNKRMSTRLKVHYPASFTSSGSKTEGVVKQISDGGLMFCCDEDFEIGTRGVFIVRIFDGKPPLTLSAEFRYRLYDSGDTGLGIKYGVRFVDMDNVQKETVSEVIRFATLRQRYMPKSTLIDDSDTPE